MTTPSEWTYPQEIEIFARVKGLLQATGEDLKQLIASVAMDLQEIHSDTDSAWLRDQGLTPAQVDAVLVRLVGRGGRWLEFIESLMQPSDPPLSWIDEANLDPEARSALEVLRRALAKGRQIPAWARPTMAQLTSPPAFRTPFELARGED
jgi:hypothetical protein